VAGFDVRIIEPAQVPIQSGNPKEASPMLRRASLAWLALVTALEPELPVDLAAKMADCSLHTL
jgi:hypothetical protein